MKYTLGAILLAILFSVNGVGVQIAYADCLAIGGTGLGSAIDESNLVASLSGALSGGARARIKAQKETSTGLTLDLEHYFFTATGGMLHTADTATLTAIPGKHKTYMLEIAYDVLESSGSFGGYKGRFQSIGLFDIGAGKVVLRYSGELCK
jgi:hypothetical protein